MMLPELVIFDLAGTVVRDDGQVPAAFTAALGEQGIPVSAEELAAVRGSSKKEAIRHFVPEGAAHNERAAQAYALFQTHLTRLYGDGGVLPINGAQDIFKWLRARDVRIAFNTGFDRAITDLLLSALGWSHRVADAVVCGDDVVHGRPAPDLILGAMRVLGVTDAQSVANVGDTTLDLLAGEKAQVGWNVGVLSGAHDRSRLSKAPHTHLLRDVSELPAVFAPSNN